MTKHYSAGSVLVNSKNQIYLIHQTARDEWLLPKGTIEKDETELETAIRETKEETGYMEFTVLTKKPLNIERYSFNHPSTGELVKKKVTYFVLKVKSMKQIKTPEMEAENLEGGWFDIDKAKDKVSFEGVKDIIDQAKEFLVK